MASFIPNSKPFTPLSNSCFESLFSNGSFVQFKWNNAIGSPEDEYLELPNGETEWHKGVVISEVTFNEHGAFDLSIESLVDSSRLSISEELKDSIEIYYAKLNQFKPEILKEQKHYLVMSPSDNTLTISNTEEFSLTKGFCKINAMQLRNIWNSINNKEDETISFNSCLLKRSDTFLAQVPLEALPDVEALPEVKVLRTANVVNTLSKEVYQDFECSVKRKNDQVFTLLCEQVDKSSKGGSFVVLDGSRQRTSHHLINNFKIKRPFCSARHRLQQKKIREKFHILIPQADKSTYKSMSPLDPSVSIVHRKVSQVIKEFEEKTVKEQPKFWYLDYQATGSGGGSTCYPFSDIHDLLSSVKHRNIVLGVTFSTRDSYLPKKFQTGRSRVQGATWSQLKATFSHNHFNVKRAYIRNYKRREQGQQMLTYFFHLEKGVPAEFLSDYEFLFAPNKHKDAKLSSSSKYWGFDPQWAESWSRSK